MTKDEVIKICIHHGELTKNDIYFSKYKNKNVRKCKKCIKAKCDRYLLKCKADPKWIEKQHKRSKLYWQVNNDEIKKQRKYPEALAKRREDYRKDHVKNRETANKRERNYRKNLHDVYIKRIIQNGDKSIKFSNIPKELIEFKRSIILLRKGIKKKVKSIVRRKLI